jgi:hypothetical protein
MAEAPVIINTQKELLKVAKFVGESRDLISLRCGLYMRVGYDNSTDSHVLDLACEEMKLLNVFWVY